MGYLGEFEQLILFALIQLGDDAYGVTIREVIEERTGRAVSAGAIYTALGRLEDMTFWFRFLRAGFRTDVAAENCALGDLVAELQRIRARAT